MPQIFYKTFFIFFIIRAVFALENVGSLGHNVSHTDYMLGKDTCTIGIQFVGCRAWNFALGSSPLLYVNYNTNNVFTRTTLTKKGPHTHTFESAYFKTFNDQNSTQLSHAPYHYEAIFAYYIYSFKYDSNVKVHFNTIYNYYINDKYPFSIRRPTVKRSPHQVNIASLIESSVTERIFVLSEFGFLHVTDTYPRLHAGSSLGYRNDVIYMHLGFTMTGTLRGIFVNNQNPNRFDLQQSAFNRRNGYYDFDPVADRNAIKEDFSIHAEFSIQVNF